MDGESIGNNPAFADHLRTTLPDWQKAEREARAFRAKYPKGVEFTKACTAARYYGIQYLREDALLGVLERPNLGRRSAPALLAVLAKEGAITLEQALAWDERYEGLVGRFLGEVGVEVLLRQPKLKRITLALDENVGRWYIAAANIKGLRLEDDDPKMLIDRAITAAEELADLNAEGTQ